MRIHRDVEGLSEILCKRQFLGSCPLWRGPAFTIPFRVDLSFRSAVEDRGQGPAQRAREGLAMTAAGADRIHDQKGEGGTFSAHPGGLNPVLPQQRKPVQRRFPVLHRSPLRNQLPQCQVDYFSAASSRGNAPRAGGDDARLGV